MGQTPVPSLDAQVAESRRGLARLVAGSYFFLLSLPSRLSVLLCGFLAFPSRFWSQKWLKYSQKNRKRIKAIPTKIRKKDKKYKSDSELFFFGNIACLNAFYYILFPKISCVHPSRFFMIGPGMAWTHVMLSIDLEKHSALKTLAHLLLLSAYGRLAGSAWLGLVA